MVFISLFFGMRPSRAEQTSRLMSVHSEQKKHFPHNNIGQKTCPNNLKHVDGRRS